MSAATGNPAIRPFTVEISEAELQALRRRVADTRWPDKETVPDHSQGVQLDTIRELARYWASDYDSRRCEAKLSALPNFKTDIDGLDIHFIHVRSDHDDALPLILTHGWPGSVIELLKVIDPLTNPTAHGGTASDAFHVVIPSMPGYGYSDKPRAPGWGPDHLATAWVELMKRLGYKHFVAQGGDWGAVVTDLIAAQAPPELLGMHTNMPGVIPPEIAQALPIPGQLAPGDPPPAGLSADEQRAFEQISTFYTSGAGYAVEMGTQPQTLYGVADSPVGLAAWMINHDAYSYGEIAQAFEGNPVGELTRDEILDNVTLYWLTNTGISSGRLYWDNTFGFFDTKNVSIPAGVSVFPGEIYQAPRSWAERAYPNLIHYNKLDRGGHFAAWEQPQLLSEEVRATFRTLR
ncbi:MAG TPA: alpha/beta fold hydrolase [Streptosporangiaceae bacterium]|jgi:pimeloyl-ACP methyl ester carboxylesterase|nr:alpha/beta fold hydrolase [Streptosporangiaceae bacterium]